MARTSRHFKQRLMLFSACGLVAGLVPAASALAQSVAPAAQSGPGVQVAQTGTVPTTTPSKGSSEDIIVRAQRQLLKDKNSPSAVTELGAKAIDQIGVGGSIATLLRQAPSVYVYQQGIGNNEPVLTIRGVRGLEVAQTLDDVPMQDLLYGGGGAFLQNILGGKFNLDQIDGVELFPGVAYPDKNTFGTIGGTVAYSSKRPTADQYVDVFGSVGSFGLFNEGFTANTGAMDGALGSGDNAPRALIQYSNNQSKGYVDYTPARYNNFLAAFDKPYDDGLSKFQATVLFNTANGLYTPEAVPLPYLDLNGKYSNYDPTEQFQRQENKYFTGILKDSTYVNDYLTVGLTGFYEHIESINIAYANPTEFGPGGVGGSDTVGGAAPFIQVPAGFGEEGDYGPGGVLYSPTVYPYNPAQASCPASVVKLWGAGNGTVNPCGISASYTKVAADTYGIQPRMLISPPDFFGIEQAIHIGGLAAKETSPAAQAYGGQGPNFDLVPANLTSGFDGGVQRTIYQAYAQDKIDVLNNTLHITPGVTWEGTKSSFIGSQVFLGTPSAATLASAYCQAGNPCLFGYYKATKWDRDVLPFFNIAYDLSAIYAPLKGAQIYASTGSSALFAPVADFGPNLAGPPPNASIVHLYEGGIKYNTATVSGLIAYYYQKIDRDFGFFQNQTPGPDFGQELYTNSGQRETKGFEAQIQWQVTPDIQLFGNASYNRARYLVTELADVTVQEEQFGLVTKGSPVTGIPDWLSTFGVDYTHKSTFRDGDALAVRAEGQYTGHQYTTYDLDGSQNIGTIPNVPFKYGSYQYYSFEAGSTTYDPNGGISPSTIFNLDVNYTLPTPELPFLKKLKFDLNFQNLFNTFTWAYYYKQISPTNCGVFTSGPFKGQNKSGYGCTPEFADGVPNEPFNVTFTVTARF